MKAIQIHGFGGAEVLKLETVSDPKPAAGQVVVTLKAIGVNPVDTYIRSGMYGDRSFPYTPGMDGAGVVKSIGPDVKNLSVNDKVYVAGSLSGTYAEQVLCNASQVHRLPEKVSFEQGAAVGVPYTTAYYALFYRGRAIPGETILIHGATGSVGSAAVQMARAHGLIVIGTGGTEKGRQLVKEEGAHHVLDHHAPDYLDALMKLTNAQGVNLILEMLANVNLGKDLKVLASRGRVVVVGNRGPVEIDPREMMKRNADIRGMSIMYLTDAERTEIHYALGAGLESAILKPIVGQKLPLVEAARAQEVVLEPGASGKVVLIP
jgi:NADPH2:quinone reductase